MRLNGSDPRHVVLTVLRGRRPEIVIPGERSEDPEPGSLSDKDCGLPGSGFGSAPSTDHPSLLRNLWPLASSAPE